MRIITIKPLPNLHCIQIAPRIFQLYSPTPSLKLYNFSACWFVCDDNQNRNAKRFGYKQLIFCPHYQARTLIDCSCTVEMIIIRCDNKPNDTKRNLPDSEAFVAVVRRRPLYWLTERNSHNTLLRWEYRVVCWYCRHRVSVPHSVVMDEKWEQCTARDETWWLKQFKDLSKFFALELLTRCPPIKDWLTKWYGQVKCVHRRVCR